MVAKKKVTGCFHVAVIPKAPRSDRRRRGFKKKSDGNQTCAIELLAAVAGKLLLENEGSSASSNEKETTDISVYEDYIKKDVNHNYDRDDLFKAGALNQKEIVCVPQSESYKDILKHVPNQVLLPESEPHSQEASVVSNSDCFGNGGLNLGILEGIDASSKFVRKREEEYSRSYWESCERVTGGGFVKHIESEEVKTVNVVNIVNGNSPTKSVRSPSSKGYTPVTSSLKHRIFSLGSRDDDENIFRCNQHSTKVKAYRPITCRRVQKFLTYKYKKVSPAWKDHKYSNTVRGMMPVCQNRKTYCGRERCMSDIPVNKRKLFDQRSVLTADRGISDESFCNMLEKSMKKNPRCSTNLRCDANGASSSLKGYKSSFGSKDSHVTLSIKSLRLPEIYIEVSENATVASLKRKVLEAVTAMISRVQVGVRLRGRKIRDDSRSLLQTGIASKDNAGKLGFELEPNSIDVPLTLCEEAPVVLSNVSNQLNRLPISPPIPSASFVASDHLPDLSPQATIDNHSESNHDMVLALAPGIPLSNCEMESKAIVPYSEMNPTPLTVVSKDQKARSSELAHRRTRRPFSVTEVEALIESVEKLGTGRWRDVKICAFDNANHRTYVDLKDKWKTLVHTAHIAPQQRRGQPVPQELLDRVLAAHAYWSQHQAKQICKHRDEVPSLTATEVE